MGCKGICVRYKAIKPPMAGRYVTGQKRCQVCEIFIKHEGLWCPCCGYRLRTKPRNLKYKAKLRGEFPDEPKPDTPDMIYVGQGDDPRLIPKISQEYLNAVPRLSNEQYESLKESIKHEGLHEPVSLSSNGTVLDGHTRFQICREIGIPVKYVVKDFDSDEAQKMYVVTVNLKRRQLSTMQMVELLAEHEIMLKAQRHESRKELLSKIKLGEMKPLTRQEQLENSTDYKIGEIIGVSSSTVSRTKYILKHGTPEEIEAARKGEGVNQIFRDIVQRRYKNKEFNTRYVPPPEKRTCLKCGGICRKRKMCHVHKSICCTQCDWGE